ncbi:MAG: dTMP kinase [Actinomycetota bacterium]|nr:dTMP kinase [Actinomycetota bacterium]
MGRRGRLIVLEGGEAAGKSTQSRILADRRGAVLTREPGGTALGERVRSVLLDRSSGEIAPRAELMLVLAARAEHVAEVILPALEAGRDVVCDRFEGSTLAYQGYGRGLPLEEVRAACAVAAGGLEPDCTVLVEVDDRVAAARRDGEADRIEAADGPFHERVRAGYRELAVAGGWAVVDGDASVEVVADRVAAAVEGVVGAGRPRGVP